MHVVIGVTLYNVMPVESFMSFNNLIFELIENIKTTKNFSFSFVNTKGLPVDQSRNSIVTRFLKEKDSEYLLFLDSDMIFPPNLVNELLKIDADIMTALAFRKWYPHHPTIYEYDGKNFKSLINYEPNKIIEVDGCGMACCLIKRKVMEKIKEPWFEFKKITDKERKKSFMLSEDLVFCRKVKKAGFNIKVDTGLVCGHVGGVIDERTYQGIKKLVPSQYQTQLDLALRKKEAK